MKEYVIILSKSFPKKHKYSGKQNLDTEMTEKINSNYSEQEMLYWMIYLIEHTDQSEYEVKSLTW